MHGEQQDLRAAGGVPGAGLLRAGAHAAHQPGHLRPGGPGAVLQGRRQRAGAQLHRAHRRLPGRAAGAPAVRHGRAAAAAGPGGPGWKLFWCRPIEAPYTKASGLPPAAAGADRVPDPDLRHPDHRGRGRARGGAVGSCWPRCSGELQPDRAPSSWSPPRLFVAVILSTSSPSPPARALGTRRPPAPQPSASPFPASASRRRKERMRRDVTASTPTRRRTRESAPAPCRGPASGPSLLGEEDDEDEDAEEAPRPRAPAA